MGFRGTRLPIVNLPSPSQATEKPSNFYTLRLIFDSGNASAL